MKSWRKIRRAARQAIDRIPILNAMVLASAGYRILTKEQAQSDRGGAAWYSRRSVHRQARAYRNLLADLRQGSPRIDFSVAAKTVRLTSLAPATLLEVGCGNGYYSEVFRRLCTGIIYFGTDYSDAMIESARKNYPSERFEAADATSLPFTDNSFDIVFNGVSLMHIGDYGLAIREAVRVAKSYVIFHSVPVVERRETTHLSKYAYGMPVTEIIFNRRDLEELFLQSGLRIKSIEHSIPYDVSRVLGEHSFCLTYLCEKLRPADAEPKR
jgi:SAM-dependent methyltransferase